MKYKLLFLSVTVSIVTMTIGGYMWTKQNEPQVISSTSMSNLNSEATGPDRLPGMDTLAVKAEVQAVVHDHQSSEGTVSRKETEMLPVTGEQVMAYEQSRVVIQAAIDRGTWQEADFLSIMETAGDMSQQQRLALEDMVGTALNQQKLVITDPRYIPTL